MPDTTKKPPHQRSTDQPPPAADWEPPPRGGAEAEALGPPPLLNEFPELDDVFSTLGADAFPGETTGVNRMPTPPEGADLGGDGLEPDHGADHGAHHGAEPGAEIDQSLDPVAEDMVEEDPIALEEASPEEDEATRFQASPAIADPIPEPEARPSRSERLELERRLPEGLPTPQPTSVISPPPMARATPLATPTLPPPRARTGTPPPMRAAVDEEPNILNDNRLFRQEAQRLARGRDWPKLAAITSAAVDGANWAQLPETKATLLVDLARIFRDRLKDSGSAESTFRRLIQIEPGHTDAIEFLSGQYQARGDWRALYDLYAAAIEPTWDPNLRLEWTRQIVAIATERLHAADLAIEAWERLWRLGDAQEETSRALSEVYRRAGRWDRLAAFLDKRASQLQGPERVVALREIAEVYLSGLRDQERAAQVLEQILAEKPGDPIALLALARVLARRKEWEALAELGARPLHGLQPQAVLDFRRLVADALWTAGDLERALVAHERVLEIDPADADSLKAKEEYLARTGKSEALVQFLAQRADGAASGEERARLLSRAAELAERDLDDPRLAVSLWEKRAAIEADRQEALQSLARLYESLGELGGVARALEGQLALTRHPAARVELLRKLGDHFANRMGDDTRAAACWKEITSIVPDDRATRDELIALHRRRGDFEALDTTLSQQAWRAIDDQTIVQFWRAAANNVDDNINDPARAVRAWQRVVDVAPGDEAALKALIGHYRTLGKKRELIWALEAELRVTRGAAERIARGLEIARLWQTESEGGETSARAAAIAAYERVLRFAPTTPAALAALSTLRAGTERSAFEVAAASPGGDRIALLREAIARLDPADPLGRFHAVRRLLWMSERDGAVLLEVAAAAAAAGAWVDLAAVYLRVAAETPDGEARTSHLRELATIYEDKLKDPVRAFLVLQAIGRQPIEDAPAMASLTRLATATGRHEDLLALLDGAARAGAAPAARRAAIAQRAAICELQLADSERAFHECERLLALDPHDQVALDEARRLAEKKQLHRELDALYAELWDRALTDSDRIQIAALRAALRAGPLGDAPGALDQLLMMYRVDAERPGLTEQLFAAADAEKAWDRVLPVAEARVRSLGDGASPDELSRIAELHETKRGDTERAFELYGEAFVLRPSWSELTDKLAQLAEASGRFELLASIYRVAAARSSDPQRMLDLYSRITRLYTDRLARPADALDIHQRILQLQPASLPSLDVIIEHDRTAGRHRDLRDRLQQWVENATAASAESRIPRWLEIARLSREKLGDAETALATFAQVLEVDATNEEALAGVRSLTEGPIDPNLEMRRLRIELRRAAPERRVEIQLTIARIQEEQIDDLDGAIATQRGLVAEAGAAGPGFAPLLRLLRTRKAWVELVDLIEAHAAALPDEAARLAALEQAVAECDEHPAAAALERKERLYRQILAAQPEDGETRRRLLSLYRDAGRLPELAELLRATVQSLSPRDPARSRFENELGRVLDRALGRLDEAEAVFAERLKRSPDDVEVLLALASLKHRRGDFAGYLALREQQARRLTKELAAFVFCHLAEACDETAGQQAKVPNYYREARGLDPTNPPAMEALKAIGRRAKSWRATAAMLPDADEAKLSWAARAARLSERGEAAAKSDPEAALGWYLRAVAVDPDHYGAWDALAELRRAQGDDQAALLSVRSSLAAFERATGPEPARLREHAERIQRLAEALRAVGDETAAGAESLRAYQLVPSYAAAALAVADQRLADGERDAAYAIYDRALREAQAPGAPALADRERLHATFQRGALAAQMGRSDDAIADLREALRIEPLHPGVLNALADVLAERGRVAAAIQHSIQALLVVHDPVRRGKLYARLGRLWQDRLDSPEEAGVCYDLAISSGEGAAADPDLMVRALKHYRRIGRTERALSVIERLLPSTTDPRELAALWTERGGILAGSDEERAIEAFDMALSYDPGAAAALTGLSQILEHRGDWEQLLQIHEARAETGVGEERAEALRSLARLASQHLHDPVRAERYLREVVELAPRKEDWSDLIAIYGDNPQKAKARRAAVSGLLAIAGPWMPRLIELGRQLAQSGERKWAWCLLSPLMNSTMPDPQLKAVVLELRKEYEKSDNSGALHPTLHEAVRHPDAPVEILELLAELTRRGPLGRTTTDELGVSSVTKLDERTAVGKTFAAVATRLGIEGVTLSRAADLQESFAILDGPHPAIVVKAELLQLLSVAETNFLFATTLELTRPGARAVAALPPEQRGLLVQALAEAAGAAAATEAAAPLARKIVALVDATKLATWKERLAVAAPRSERIAAAVIDTARRVGLVAAADLRFVARLLTRLDETLPKMQTVGKIEDLDEFIGGAPPVRSLVAFATSDSFGKVLTG